MNNYIPNDLKSVRNFLPCFSDEDFKMIESLPDNFVLQVPYYKQEEKNYCGAAVMQMFFAYKGENVPSQEEIAIDAGWTDWETFKHSTFKEELAIYMLKEGFLPTSYYPQKFVATKLNNGLLATDYIRANREKFTLYDFKVFKAQLFKTQSPLIVRIHFTKDNYPMDENMIRKYDNSGHCLLLIGYDSEGFIFHDPWDKAKWGGNRGGEYIKLSYDMLVNEYNLVNYTLDTETGGGKLLVRVIPPKQAVITNSTFEVLVEVKWVALDNFYKNDTNLQDLEFEINVEDGFEVVGENSKTISNLLPGERKYVSWELSTGNDTGSYPVEVELNATAIYPEIPWEDIPETSVEYSQNCKNRICIFDPEYLQIAGIFSD